MSCCKTNNINNNDTCIPDTGDGRAFFIILVLFILLAIIVSAIYS